MSATDRQIESALILQGTWTEALSALLAGNFQSDCGVVNVWNRIALDSRGENDLRDELEQSWARIEEIEAEAAARRAVSGEAGGRYIAAIFSYERVRSSAPAPQPNEIGQVDVSPTGDSLLSGRTIEEAVTRAIRHRIRVEILAALHEGPATAARLGRLLGQSVGALHHHLRGLLEDGGIRVVGHINENRNFNQALYSYVKLPEYDLDGWSALSPEERQAISAVTLRAAMAESLAALWKGKLHSDPRLILVWKPIVLDRLGRAALTDEQERCWKRVCALESSAEERLSASSAKVKMSVVTLLGFKRTRSRSDRICRG